MNFNEENDLTLELSMIMNLETRAHTEKRISTYSRIVDLLVEKYGAEINILLDDELFYRIESALTYEIQQFLEEQQEQ